MTAAHARSAVLASAIGIALYLLLIAALELWAARTGDQNAFFRVSVHDGSEAVVVLGASRALPLGFDDMPRRLARELGTSVVNLAMTGAGPVVNDLVLDDYLRQHGASATELVVYVLDSFVFLSPEWNEERLTDDRLWSRAPWSMALARALWSATREHGVPPSVFWRYVTGFVKVNNPEAWFASDAWESASEFDERHRPSSLRDRRRIDYLYPEDVPEATAAQYWEAFGRVLDTVAGTGAPLVVVRTPLREAFVERIPGETEFASRLEAFLDDRGVPLLDFTHAGFEAELFFDADHLNRDGVTRFLDELLVPALRPYLEGGPA